MIRRGLCLLFMLLAMLPAAALGEIYMTQPPEDWADKPRLEWTIFDVNEGDAMLLSCEGEHMLVDGGPKPFRGKLYDALAARGLTHLRYMLNTHFHDDHIDGLYFLMEEYGVTADVFYHGHTESELAGDKLGSRTVKAAQDKGIPVVHVTDGDRLTLGGAEIEIFQQLDKKNANYRSLVLRVSYKDSSILLCADVPGEAQHHLREDYPAGTMDSDLIKMPHHALSVAMDSFLDVVSPVGAVVTNKREDVFSKAAYQFVKRELPVYYSGEGTVYAVTDGTDWYFWQTRYEF